MLEIEGSSFVDITFMSMDVLSTARDLAQDLQKKHSFCSIWSSAILIYYKKC